MPHTLRTMVSIITSKPELCAQVKGIMPKQVKIKGSPQKTGDLSQVECDSVIGQVLSDVPKGTVTLRNIGN
jgi:hypothetical protein